MRPLVEKTAAFFRPPSAKGRDWQAHAHLYLVRLTALLFAVLIPSFGVFYRAAHPGAVDPLAVRFGIAAGALGLFGLTYASAWVRRHAPAVLFLLACVLMAWFAAVAYLNAFSADYAVGFFCVWTAAAMIISLAFDRVDTLFGYIIFTLAVSIGLIVVHPAPGIDAVLYFSSMLTAAAAVYVAVSVRIEVQGALAEREHHLAEAQRTAGLGNWEVGADGRVYWSDEMYRIAGLTPDAAPSFDALAARVHFDDRAALFAFFDALRAGREPDDLTLRVTDDDGRIRTVRLRGAAERAGGRAPRLHGVALDVTAEAERARVLLEAKEQAEAAREEAERAREEAEHARRRAEELARVKGAFLENMSHELRTPLTAIIGFAQVLAEEVDDGLRDLVAPIEQSGKRLLGTLNAVLDLASLRGDGVAVDLRAVDVAEEAHEAAEAFRPLAQEKGLALTVAAPVCGVAARADRAALRRVLHNLLSNAVKFTDEGRVTLAVEPVGAHVRLRVRDTGRGMAPAFLPKLFEEFRQESTGTARSHEGSGLGLAITRGLVDLMGGSIAVESTPGEGSVFTVLLPRAEGPGADAEAPPAERSTLDVQR
ncbi:MAG TPA: PAS domain-containing sensor histidine kinase [Rubricoccaceae bacterium]|nr:PAS domain-containing sensor histidine kinase [Rubricoccaceae bacterium]